MTRALHSIPLGVLAVLLLAGCKAGPDYAAPPAPASVALGKGAFLRAGQEAAAPPLDRWWEQLGDTTLDGLVAQGLKNAPGIAEARARVAQARAGLTAAHAGQLPEVSANAAYVHAHLPSNSLGNGLGGSDLSALGFDAQWELDIWGGQRRAVEKARAGAEAQEAQLADAQVALSAEIVRAYVSLRAQEASHALLSQEVALDRRNAALIEARYAAGTVGQQAAESARAQLDRATAEEARSAAEMAIWRDSLAVLTGQAPGALDALPAGEIPLPPAQVAIGDPGAMLARRPDIRAAERAYAAATAGVGEAQARRYPGISLVGLLGVGGSSFSNLVNSGQGAAILMPRLTWDFPDMGRVTAAVHGAKAERAGALAHYNAAVLAGLQDAEAALGLGHAETTAALEEQRAGAGVISQSDAIAAREQAISARLADIDARSGLTLRYAALAKALGLGWGG